jgi:malate dehydrogenase (oxaloacetate-decarboxylating)(NADP+)
VGLGVIAAEARHVTDEMFLAAARALANEASEDDLKLGRIYPSLDRIRSVSAHIARAVAEVAFDQGLARFERPTNLSDAIRSLIFEPTYANW